MLTRHRSYIAILLCGILVSITCGAIAAPAVSAEQLDAFRSLSPAQREQVLNRLSPEQRALAEKSLEQGQGDEGEVDKSLDQPEVVKPTKLNTGDAPMIQIEDNSNADKDSKNLDSSSDQNNLSNDPGDQFAHDGSKSDELIQYADQTGKPQILKQYGYDLFSGAPTTFAPATDIPVPSEYVLGPGDVVQIQLFGKESASYSLAVTRDGTLQFPKLGPIAVAGLSYVELKQQISELVSKQLIGQEVNVSMGQLRSIRVFVLGEANRPGSYTVSALSTMTNALFVSGGLSTRGSLRSIQLKRNGNVVSEMDLYSLLMHGDTSQDVRLQPGDVLFVPTIGQTAAVAGEVKRPAIYELRDEKTVGDLLELAGGQLATAFGKGSRIARINQRGDRTVVNVNTDSAEGKRFQVKNGDVLNVFSVLDAVEDAVHLSGHVLRPGSFEWKRGMRVHDVIKSANDLMPNPDLEYALVKRETMATRTSEVLYVNLGEVFRQPGGPYDIQLQPRDALLVFGLDRPRSEQLTTLVDILKMQGTFANPPRLVTVKGDVRFPGEYPLFSGMSVADLIRSARDLSPDADLNYLLLVRSSGAEGRIQTRSLRLDPKMYLSQGKAVSLQARDTLIVFNAKTERTTLLAPVIKSIREQTTPSQRQSIVTVSGSVKFPGEYPMSDAYTVNDLIVAAGGLLSSAYGINAEITRFSVNQNSSREVSHFTIDLVKRGDMVLQSEDELHIQQIPNWDKAEVVSIQGEVRFPGKYVISKNDTIRTLLSRAGGLTEFADPNAAIFLRESLRLKEQEMLDQLSKRLRAEVVSTSIEKQKPAGADAEKEGDAREKLVQQISETKATGRLVLNLPGIIKKLPDVPDVELRANDNLLIPRRRQEVSVIGEVNFPTAQIYRDGLGLADYILGSGGVTARADKPRIFVVRANGEVMAGGQSRWFRYSDRDSIRPGDTIVVPYDIDPVNSMQTWTSVSQILFQMATSAAALKTIGIF